MSSRMVFASVFLLGVAVAPSGPAQAASAVQSTNCPNGLCAQFDFDDPVSNVKSYSFSMPSAGAASVTFSGSLFCAASGSPLQDRVIDLNSGISTGSTGAITPTVPSYMRHAHVLKDDSDHIFDTSTSFNLQSTRVINYTSGGAKTVYFRITRARQDQGVTCYVYGGSFAVIRTP